MRINFQGSIIPNNSRPIEERVESHPDVSGGDPCIVGTRIPVWALVRYRQLGLSDDELLEAYPSLTPEDLGNAWEFYHRHAEEIERQIFENETA